MKYSKVFDEHSEYETYILNNNYLIPNISCCKQESDIHYNKWIEKRIKMRFLNVETTYPYYLIDGSQLEYIKAMWIDDVEITPTAEYTFSLEGNYTLYIELNDNTTIPLSFLLVLIVMK